jgi:hypothetical protein
MTPVRAEPCHLCGELSEYMLHIEQTDEWCCLHCLNAEPGSSQRDGDAEPVSVN